MFTIAGPRRLQKLINLPAKTNAWSNDNENFGQKMGWRSGEGFGAKEDGIVKHVMAKYKNNEKGLGFEDRNDQWTKHEDDFYPLLGNLSKADRSDEKLHSGISLEIKSKKSKARIHYHKFTYGKDLSRYRTKDLANIIGKKTFQIESEEIKDVKSIKQPFTEKGSMADYFKNKLPAFLTNSKTFLNNGQKRIDEQWVRTSDEQMVFNFQGFSGTLNVDTESGMQPFSFYGFGTTAANGEKTQPNRHSFVTDIKTKKKKEIRQNIGKIKNKKDQPITTPSVGSEEENFDVDTDSIDNIKEKKKEPKQQNYTEIKEQNNHNVTDSVCSKKKIRKTKNGFQPITTPSVGSEEENFDVDKDSIENIKEKKKESKQQNYTEIKEQNNHNVTDSVCSKKKIRKTKNGFQPITTPSVGSEEENFDVDTDSIENIKEKKKQSKLQNYTEIEEQNNHNVSDSVCSKKKIRKTKNGFQPITTPSVGSEEEHFDVDTDSFENIKKKKKESKQQNYTDIKEQNNHNVTESVSNKENKRKTNKGKGHKTIEIVESIQDIHIPKNKRKKNGKVAN